MGLLGLSRDPFCPGCTGSLFWETEGRAAVREELRRVLEAGQSVWVRGEPGSGRGALLARVADESAASGVRVLCPADTAPVADAQSFLRRLGDVVGAPLGRTGVLEAAEVLYRCLLEAFCVTGPVVVVPATDPLPRIAYEEAEILAGLQVAGRPLAALALAGESDPPFPGLHELRLPAAGPEDLRDCLSHRAAVCGNPSLFSPDRLDRVVEGARGLGEAVAAARREVARMAFELDTPRARFAVADCPAV